MALDTVGILTPIDFTLEQPQVLMAVAREVFTNEQPLFAQLPHRGATSEVYTIDSYEVRQRDYTVGTGGITNSATSLPIADASPFQVGDVLEITPAGTGVAERVEVVAAPTLTTTPNTLTIRRGREGTTGAAAVATDPIRLIGNSRTGGEIDQQAFRTVVTQLEQYVQTFQYPVQVGGKSERVSNVVLPPGTGSVMGRDRAIKLVEAVRDVEHSFYYGLGEKPSATGDRAKMKGLRKLIQSYNAGANVTTGAGASYTLASFTAATFQKIFDAGGMPDVVVCSTNFMTFLNTWVPGKQTIMNNQTPVLGFPIRAFSVPLMGGPITIVPAPQLRPGTAIVMTSSDVEIRTLAEFFWKPREARGDAMEGDWIADYAINVNRPKWHAWVEGITSAA